jgi:hypothetical protein
MAPISVQFLDIRAGISRSPWDALFHRGGYRVSSRAAPHVATGKHDAVRAAMRAQGWLPGRDVTVFSDGDVGLQSIVLSATREPVTHILDWFHLSMRLRHIEQTWQGLRHIGDLNIYLRDVAIDVPRLRHLLWSGYVREATRAVKEYALPA